VIGTIQVAGLVPGRVVGTIETDASLSASDKIPVVNQRQLGGLSEQPAGDFGRRGSLLSSSDSLV